MLRVWIHVFAALLLVLAYAFAGRADHHYASVKIEAVPVAENLHMLTGRGGNIGVLTGADGVLMVDDQFAPLTEKILAAIAKLGEGPVRFVLNTHHHGDHVGGNENLGKRGSVIVAHQGVRLRLLSELGADPDRSHPSLPVVTFADSLTIHANGVDVRVEHLANAHTDGDAIVWFGGLNAVHLGDLYFNGKFPYIDVDSGGSVAGLFAAIEKILAAAKSDTAIIPGHGALSNRAELETYLSMIKTVRDRVQQQIDAGATVEAAIAAKPTAEFDAQWDGGFIPTERFVRIVYRSLSGG